MNREASRPCARQRRGGRRGLEADGEKHDVLFGIEACQLQRVGGRIHDADVHPASFVLERAALGPGDAHHVTESGKDYVRILRDGQAVVDASHGKHADRTAGPMDQFDIFRKNILKPKAIDGVRVAATDFHDVDRTAATALISDLGDESANFLQQKLRLLRISEFVDVFHGVFFLFVFG